MKGIALCLSLLLASSAWATSAEESLCGRPSVPVVRMEKQEKFCRSFSRAMAALPGAMAADTQALLSPENIAVMGLLTTAWLGAQGVPVVGQAVDAALFAFGVSLLVGQAADLTQLLWSYVNLSTAARVMADLDEAATYLARAMSMVGLNVVAFVLTKKALTKVPKAPSSRPVEFTPPKLSAEGGLTVEGMAEGTVEQTPSALVAPTILSASRRINPPGLSEHGGRTLKTPEPRAFRTWLRRFPRRPVPDKPEAPYAFQKRNAGSEEILVEGGGEKIWADGARADDAHLLEVKYVEKPDSSPFIEGSSCNAGVRDSVREKQAEQLRRYAEIIRDPTTPVVGLEVVVNDERAVAYFQSLMRQLDIPGRVVVGR